MAQRCAVHTLGRSSIQYDALSNGHGTGKRLNCLWGLIKASNKWRILQSVPGREKKKKRRKDVVMRKTMIVMTQTMIKHLLLRELQVIVYYRYTEGKLGLKLPMSGNEAGT